MVSILRRQTTTMLPASGALLHALAILSLVSCGDAFFLPAAFSSQNARRQKNIGQQKSTIIPYHTYSSTSSTTSLRMGLLDLFKSESTSKNNGKDDYTLKILDVIGSGSYGTVHLAQLLPKSSSCAELQDAPLGQYKIAKRAWNTRELHDLALAAAAKSASESKDADLSATGPHKIALKSKSESSTDEERIRARAERCRYYLDVEGHCLGKLSQENEVKEGKKGYWESVEGYVPKLIGSYYAEDDDMADGDNSDGESKEWLVFDLVTPDGSTGDGITTEEGSSTTIPPTPAQTLSEILDLDWTYQHTQDEADPNSKHHLYLLQKALGLPEESTFGDTLDKTLVELLKCVSVVNEANVVHRDVKPGNLLVTSGRSDSSGSKKSDGKEGGGFVLIDFGSAADMDPPSTATLRSALGGNGGRIGLQDSGTVALSPIYAAPEMFVKWDRAPLNFDSFSTALVFAQLLFNLLDERADASYRQQLEDCEHNLDACLKRVMNDELQPDGLEDAVLYLGERPGLWAVLRQMLHPNPERRMSTSEAMEKVEKILEQYRKGQVLDIADVDGKYFAAVVALFEQCDMPDSGSAVGVVVSPPSPPAEVSEVAAPLSAAERALVMPRPLHYVATFSRSESLGLLLSEVDPDGEYDDELEGENVKAWEEATANAQPGEVYVRGVIEGGQAEKIGVFEVGDRLMGVGEFPFFSGGFGVVVQMLQQQPPSAKVVTLHFDRKSVGRAHAYERTAPHLAKVVGQGAWSAKGRRKTQEDRFILHEVHDGNNAALLCGVFDGHGGDAASKTLSQLLPSLFSVELAGMLGMTDSNGGKATASDLREAMTSAYEITCNTYRNGCDEEGTCVADYDPREGIVLAGTGAKDLIAGSTVTTSVLSVTEDGADELSVLNCGDSRTLVVGRPRGGSPKDSVVHFSTRDHSPSCELEMERLALGKDKGYSQPKCSMSRWRIKVGDYQYALARSLEGSFATSLGIVSDPDISVINLSEMLAERDLGAIILASDGLFEVIDNEEAGRVIIKWREAGQSADEVAKQLCRKAVDKGSPDNVSIVVIYLE